MSRTAASPRPAKRKNRSGKRARKPRAKVGHPVLKLRGQLDRHAVAWMVARVMIAGLSGRPEPPATLPTAGIAVAQTTGVGVPFLAGDGALVQMFDNPLRRDGSRELDAAIERNRRRLAPVLERLRAPDAMTDPDMVWLCHNVTAQVAQRAPSLILALFETDMVRGIFATRPEVELPYRLFADRPHLLANYCACESGESQWWREFLEAGPGMDEVVSLLTQIAR